MGIGLTQTRINQWKQSNLAPKSKLFLECLVSLPHCYKIIYMELHNPKSKSKARMLQKREKAFVQYVKTMKVIKHSITLTQLRQKVAKITQEKGKRLPRMSFQGRLVQIVQGTNPNLLVKVAHSLELGHVKGLCPTNVESFYTNLTQEYNLHNYMPKCI
jgi:hypothetical protein